MEAAFLQGIKPMPKMRLAAAATNADEARHSRIALEEDKEGRRLSRALLSDRDPMGA